MLQRSPPPSRGLLPSRSQAAEGGGIEWSLQGLAIGWRRRRPARAGAGPPHRHRRSRAHPAQQSGAETSTKTAYAARQARLAASPSGGGGQPGARRRAPLAQSANWPGHCWRSAALLQRPRPLGCARLAGRGSPQAGSPEFLGSAGGKHVLQSFLLPSRVGGRSLEPRPARPVPRLSPGSPAGGAPRSLEGSRLLESVRPRWESLAAGGTPARGGPATFT